MPRNPQSAKYANWCFTLNHPTEEEITELESKFNDSCSYWIYGREVAPSTGTPHLQGYLRLKVRSRFQTIKNRFNSRLHVESARGSVGQNREYCSKSGEVREGGKIPPPSGEGASHATRSESASSFRGALDDAGRTGLVQFAGEYPGEYFFSGHNMLRNWLQLQSPIDRPTVEVSWFYGKPGTGKSRRAHAEFPDAFIKEPRTKWWSGYMLESSVIIDDFGPNGIDINHLLRWFDRYKCWVESKGGMVPLWATKFVVTSNFHPSEVFRSFEVEHPQLPALLRRMTLVTF